MVNADCVRTAQMQKAKGQGHMRSKLDLEAWQSIILDLRGSSSFSGLTRQFNFQFQFQ